MTTDSELESLGCYPFHLPPEQPKRNAKEEKALCVVALQVVPTSADWVQAAGWREFLRMELVRLSGQSWEVAVDLLAKGSYKEVHFLCLWEASGADGVNRLRLPPLSFDRLAEMPGRACHELSEYAQTVVLRRATL